MHEAGMAATLKHFPGHGSVPEDTHFDVAVDDRSLEAMRATDLVPFVAGIAAGADAVMMAHVTYPQVAPEPAGYSPRWIGEILRGEMGFRGVVFSDDIGMAAAFRRRGEGAHRCAPRCRLRRGAGLPSGAGRGIPARR
jgi:beta-N-acetylhexosaminidase